MPRFRFFIVISSVCVAFAAIGTNLYYVQIHKGDFYSGRAESQFRLAGALNPTRGIIYVTDKNNNAIPAAINKPYPVIFAVPREIEDVAEVANALVPILGLDVAALSERLQKNNLYELLVRRASDAQVAAVRELSLPGVYIDTHDLRYYPFGTLAAQLLGFVGPDSAGMADIGTYGVESYYEDALAGSPGTIKDKKITHAIPGSDLQLTIDGSIQAQAEEVLANLVRTFRATGGSVIVQEPATGRLLAIGNYPTFDPNQYAQANLADFVNSAVQRVYEPGSVFKVLTMAIGIETGAITPQTTYNDTGSFQVRDRTIKNWDLKARGRVTMTEAIEHSINTATAYAQQLIGRQPFYNFLQKLGLGKMTEVALPDEATGSLAPLADLRNPVYFATAAFGQGISVTPIQLITAISTIANGGHLMKPLIAAADEPEEVTAVFSKSTAEQVTAMMEGALTKAEIGRVAGYRLAGKTGTAQVPNFKRGGYTKNVINTYVGFGPVSNPKFIILIKLDEPAGAPLAGQTVVPAFRELAQFILNYYNIPPDAP